MAIIYTGRVFNLTDFEYFEIGTPFSWGQLKNGEVIDAMVPCPDGSARYAEIADESRETSEKLEQP